MKLSYSILILTYWLLAACAVGQRTVETDKAYTERDRYIFTQEQTLLATYLEMDSVQLKEMLRLALRLDGYDSAVGSYGLNTSNLSMVIDSLQRIDTLLLRSMLLVGLSYYEALYGEKISNDCRCRGIPLYGAVKVVPYNATFKVRITNSKPALKVRKVPMSIYSCGEWYFVEDYEDFTIEYVNSGEDFTISFVSSYPGID